MNTEKRVRRRLGTLFLFGMILLNYPILSLFNRDTLFFGLPLLYVYLFCCWLLFILAIIIISNPQESTREKNNSGEIDKKEPNPDQC